MQSTNLDLLNAIERTIQGFQLSKALAEAIALDFLPTDFHNRFVQLSARYQSAHKLYYIEGVYEGKEYRKEEQGTVAETLALLAEARQRLLAPPGNMRRLGKPIEHFVGRGEFLEDLFKGLTEGNHVQVLHGIMGIGKSRIVVEHAYRNINLGAYPNFVAWIDASSGQAMVEVQWLDLAADLLPDVPANRQKEALFRKMATEKHWLLAFINAPNPEVVKEYIPPRIEGHVLITTANPTWESIAPGTQVRPVTSLDDESSELLLQRRSKGKIDKTTALSLNRTIEGYPFFLEAWAALYAEPMVNTKTLEFALKNSSSTAGDELEKRREDFLQGLMSIIGLKKDKPARFKGEAQAVLLIQMMAPRNISTDFMDEYVQRLLIHKEPDNPLIRFFAQPFLNWLKKRNAIQSKQRWAFLKKLADCSFIQQESANSFSMPGVVHDFFRNEVFFTRNLLPANMLVGMVLDFATDKFRVFKNKPESLEECRRLLPHMISMADYCRRYFPNVDHLELLHQRIIDFFEREERYSPALMIAAEAMDWQCARPQGPNPELIQQFMMLAIVNGNFSLFDALTAAFGKTGQIEPFKLAVLEALNKYHFFDHPQTVELLDRSIKMTAEANADPDAILSLQLLAASLLVSIDRHKGEEALASVETAILQKVAEKSEEYAMFLAMKSEAYLRFSEADDTPEVFLIEADQLSERASNILVEVGKGQSLMFWLTLLQRADCQRILGDYEKCREIMSILEKNQSTFEEKLGSQHPNLASFYFIKAHLCHLDSEDETGREHLEKAVSILREAFPDNPEHPLRRLMESMLDEIKNGD